MGASPTTALPTTALPADEPAQASHRVKLRILHGPYGTDKVYCLTALEQPAEGVVVLFVGDQLEARHLPEQLLALQVSFPSQGQFDKQINQTTGSD